MTDKQARFCREYTVDFNGTRAAIRSGYAESNARYQASRLLTYPHVRAEIEKLIEARAEQTEVDRRFVIEGLKENFHRAMEHKPVLDRKGEPTGRYMYSGSVANKALELLGKSLAEGSMFLDKVELSGDVDLIKRIQKGRTRAATQRP